MSKTKNIVVKDYFSNESAVLASDGVCQTFGVNCGATFRATVRFMSRVQAYLSEHYDIDSATVNTTNKALERLFIELDIVNETEASHYFDTRKESVIEEANAKIKADFVTETAKQAAKADAIKLDAQVVANIAEAFKAKRTVLQIATKMRESKQYSDDEIAAYLPRNTPERANPFL